MILSKLNPDSILLNEVSFSKKILQSPLTDKIVIYIILQIQNLRKIRLKYSFRLY